MPWDILNAFYTATWAEQIWFTCVQEFGATFRAIFVLKCALYGLKTTYNSFRNFLGDFIRDLGFTLSRTDQGFWMIKSYKYDGYNYIATHVDEIIIAAKDPSKYMNETEQKFQVQNIIDSLD